METKEILYLAKVYKWSEIVIFLWSHQLVSHNFKDAIRRHETPGSETQGFINLAWWGYGHTVPDLPAHEHNTDSPLGPCTRWFPCRRTQSSGNLCMLEQTVSMPPLGSPGSIISVFQDCSIQRHLWIGSWEWKVGRACCSHPTCVSHGRWTALQKALVVWLCFSYIHIWEVSIFLIMTKSTGTIAWEKVETSRENVHRSKGRKMCGCG